MRFGFLHVLTLGLCLLSPTAMHAATRDACSLIAPADAQAALGEAVGQATAENRGYGKGQATSCKFRSTRGSAISGKSISLEVRYSDDDLTGSAKGIAENFQAAGFKNVHQVPGVGSSAVWASNSIFGKLQGELTVIQGKSIMLIILINGLSDEATAVSNAKVLAAKALGRL